MVTEKGYAVKERRRMASLTQHLLVSMQKACEGRGGSLRVNGPALDAGDAARLPNTLNVGFEGLRAGDLIARTEGKLAFSAASACHKSDGDAFISPVIRALGTPRPFALGSIRLSVGKYTSRSEIDTAARLLSTAANELWAEQAAAAEAGMMPTKEQAGAKASNGGEGKTSAPAALAAATPVRAAAADATADASGPFSPLASVMSAQIAALPGTKPAFWQDTYLFQGSAAVVATGVDLHPKDQSEMPFVVLDATVFHPQGGGQPTDVGTIANGAVRFSVTMVRQQPDGVIKHYGEYNGSSARFTEGDGVDLAVDGENRVKAARSHSAGHLLDIAMQRALAPAGDGGMREDMRAQVQGNMKGLKGYHFIKGSYVEFEGKVDPKARAPFVEVLQRHCDALVAANIETNVQFVETEEALLAACLPGAADGAIASGRLALAPVRVVMLAGGGIPCGGTHVRSTGEIGAITVTKCKVKKGVTKISYTVAA